MGLKYPLKGKIMLVNIFFRKRSSFEALLELIKEDWLLSRFLFFVVKFN